MTHTPGPWTWLERTIEGRKIGDYAIVVPPNGYCVAQCDGNPDNARLIAAAPDLLRELKLCVLRLKQKGEPVSAALAAIAKAEGEPS